MSLETALQSLSPEASESEVERLFSAELLSALGFCPNTEIVSQHKLGRKEVDWAAGKVSKSSALTFTQDRDRQPSLYLEAKSRQQNLQPGSRQYLKHLAQLEGYLRHKKSASVQWGILTNSLHAQLFCKHGKVVFPATPCLEVDATGENVVSAFKKRMRESGRALTCAVYSNKGGVGKTSTTINIASTLASFGKKVLVIDLDPNQGDLTKSLGLDFPEEGLSLVLSNKIKDLREAIVQYQYKKPRGKEIIEFDVLPTDKALFQDGKKDNGRRRQYRAPALLRAIVKIKDEYDYVFIDAPPGIGEYPKMALCASDVALLPASPNNLDSLRNAAAAISTHLPNTCRFLQESPLKRPGPIPLLVLGNNFSNKKSAKKILELSEAEVTSIVKENKEHYGIDLERYFWPHTSQNGLRKKQMIGIETSNYILQARFSKIPAICAHQTVRKQFKKIAEEFFI